MEDSPTTSNITSIDIIAEVFSGYWSFLIFNEILKKEPARFSILTKAVGVSNKSLTLSLRKFEATGLITRKVFAQVPPRVEYRLTSMGRELIPIFEAMRSCNAKIQKQQESLDI